MPLSHDAQQLGLKKLKEKMQSDLRAVIFMEKVLEPS